MTLLRSSPSGRAIDLDIGETEFGLQTAWAINPLVGNDNAAGTPTAPLRTMAEFNARMASQFVRVPQTLQLVGDVIDAPLTLAGTHYTLGASLTVDGTVTPIGTANITAVTSLGAPGSFPWQLDTVGIDVNGNVLNWTTIPVNTRLAFSNGSFAFIKTIVSATRIIIGSLTAFVGGSANLTPTTAFTITLQSLSRGLPPLINAFAATNSSVATPFTMRGLSLLPLFNYNFAGGIGVLIAGCELICTSTNSISTGPGGRFSIRACLFTCGSASSTILINASGGGGNCNYISNVYVGTATGILLFQGASINLTGATVKNMQVQASLGAVLNIGTGLDIEHTTTAFRVDTGAIAIANTPITGTSGTGYGCDVLCGSLLWNGAANKPTINTGGTFETRIGGTNYTYAQIGVGKTSSYLDLIPPTVTTLINNATRGPGIATMSQIG